KPTAKKSQSEESMKAEVCPWEAPGSEVTAKAEICPWEVAAPPSTQEKSKQHPDALSRASKASKEPGDRTATKKGTASRDRESICPWESTDTEGSSTEYSKRREELQKDTAKKSQSEESLKAEVCPWEAPGSEATAKADICPWEVAAALPEKASSPTKLSLPVEKAGAPQPPE
ncbi:GP179 protein, partial [Upupa epops]|nr:GP179 protein [Upupa epops]